MKKKYRTQGTKTVYTAAHLRQISFTLLEAADNLDGDKHYCAAAMLFSALSLEAFLNHVANQSIPYWHLIERKMSTQHKLEVLSLFHNLELDYSRRPFRTFRRMIKFRNDMAHGQTEELQFKPLQYLGDDEGPNYPDTKWEKEITLMNAKMYFDDAAKIVTWLSAKVNQTNTFFWLPFEAEYSMEEIK